jgi:hypothetical protein
MQSPLERFKVTSHWDNSDILTTGEIELKTVHRWSSDNSNTVTNMLRMTAGQAYQLAHALIIAADNSERRQD